LKQSLHHQAHELADGPDFLCIGLQKAGTGWLYDQLQFHPDFWMPPVKELHFFDRNFPNQRMQKAIAKVLPDLERASAKRVAKDMRPLDERDRDFFEAARACIGVTADLERYAALFSPKGALLAGDITPAYSGLKEAAIDEIVVRFPNIRALILLRDPVQRAMSQIAMSYRGQKAPEVAYQKVGPFKEFFLHDRFENRSFATQFVARWRARLPADRFAFFFFDDIVARPEALRRDIITFLGGDPDKTSRFEAGFNRKSSKAKLVLPQEIQDFLKDYFRDELEQSARMFGGHAEQWLARYFASTA
jgi:hypothetical protein